MSGSTTLLAIKEAITAISNVYWKDHALVRMRMRNITVNEIIDALTFGCIIEEYQTDKPFPSVLVNGKTKRGRPLHVVVGVNTKVPEIHIVTGYEPDPLRWDETFSKRKQ